MIHFHFVTLFPEAIDVWLKTSIPGKAREAGIYNYRLLNLRDFSTSPYKNVDDAPYGGGGGMVLKIEPLVAAVESIQSEIEEAHHQVLYFSPAGERLRQPLLETLHRNTPKESHFILICGHYEGVDQRFIEHWVDLEISLGDFVLTGGELPAVAFVDAFIRGLGGTLRSSKAFCEESFSIRDANNNRLLEYPHYTRPADFRGHSVPEVLLSGDHSAIKKWRTAHSILRTTANKNPTNLL